MDLYYSNSGQLFEVLLPEVLVDGNLHIVCSQIGHTPIAISVNEFDAHYVKVEHDFQFTKAARQSIAKICADRNINDISQYIINRLENGATLNDLSLTFGVSKHVMLGMIKVYHAYNIYLLMKDKRKDNRTWNS